jgi:hypothetical protein
VLAKHSLVTQMRCFVEVISSELLIRLLSALTVLVLAAS